MHCPFPPTSSLYYPLVVSALGCRSLVRGQRCSWRGPQLCFLIGLASGWTRCKLTRGHRWGNLFTFACPGGLNSGGRACPSTRPLRQAVWKLRGARRGEEHCARVQSARALAKEFKKKRRGEETAKAIWEESDFKWKRVTWKTNRV